MFLFTLAPSGPPLNFAVDVVDTSMAFSWSPPELMLQNGDIISYTVTCIGNTGTVSATTSGLEQTIDTFIPGAAFQCSVYATNDFGDGPPTAALLVQTESKLADVDARRAIIIMIFPITQMFRLELQRTCHFLTLRGQVRPHCLPVMREYLQPFLHLRLDSHSGVPADLLSM